jgi:hypothetical protein
MQPDKSQASLRTRPSTYYKFRPYNSDPASEERSWVRDTIFNDRVRFARLSELNDPFEGRPFMIPQFDDPTAQAAAVYASVLEDARKEGLSGAEAERQARFETTAALSPQVTQTMRQELLRQALNESFWIYSVSATRDPILMWSHYSDGHKGIVLHFDVRAVPFDRLFEVHYSDQYPEYAFPASQSLAPEEEARAMLYAKANGWRYEREFRAIRVLAPGTSLQLAWRGMGVDWDGQIATLPAGALTGITLGAAMPPKIVKELHAELAERRPTLELWEATVNARSYALDFRRLR